MRVLIGYDGSESGDIALNEVKRAGLPVGTEILIATIAEIWLPPAHLAEIAPEALASRRVLVTMSQLQAQAEQELDYAESILFDAARRLKSMFPTFSIETEVISGDIPTALVEKAATWKADLVLVGSRRRSMFGKILLGSVSQQVVQSAPCPVRVAHGGIAGHPQAPRRMIAAIDGSPSAAPVVQEIAGRSWVGNSVVCLVTATTSVSEGSGYSVNQVIAAQELHDDARKVLQGAGLKVLSRIREGDASTVLISEAESLSADCIFLGSRNIQGAWNQYMLGSISNAVVHSALCSVEVVKQRPKLARSARA